jgi:hypothetical protein
MKNVMFFNEEITDVWRTSEDFFNCLGGALDGANCFEYDSYVKRNGLGNGDDRMDELYHKDVERLETLRVDISCLEEGVYRCEAELKVHNTDLPVIPNSMDSYSKDELLHSKEKSIDKRDVIQVKLIESTNQHNTYEERIMKYSVYTMKALHKLNKLREEYITLVTKKGMTEDLLETMKDQTYDTDCTHCMNNPIVKRRRETEQQLSSYISDITELGFSQSEYDVFLKQMKKKTTL